MQHIYFLSSFIPKHYYYFFFTVDILKHKEKQKYIYYPESTIVNILPSLSR